MLKRYLVYLPEVEGSIEDEWNQCLKKIIGTTSSGLRPVKLNIFVDLPDFESFLLKRALILKSVEDHFMSECPAVNISVHPPERPWKVSVEATFLSDRSAIVVSKRHKGINYLLIGSNGNKELWAAGVSSYDQKNDTRKAASGAFDLMIEILETEKMSANNIVRQWNYIGNILGINDGQQNYQIFNEVRNEYYSRFRTAAGYPAATGVGMKHGGVILDFCALEASVPSKIMAIDNPNQVNAYNYGQQVLVGKNKESAGVKHAPQFERALLIADERDIVLHISGTASIVGQETMGKGDVAEQTIVTIENIRKLASAAGAGQFMLRNKFTLFRVYIKRKADFDIVRKICNDHFPGVPSVLIEADICRDDLLMEIEAEAELEK